mmetsp:Transcript_68566/g.107964  ORF Transcript_68566/g.107964 Transcript_68566/m.107964 type:complete len:168 (+) Transcript_68566:49-552(+)
MLQEVDAVGIPGGQSCFSFAHSAASSKAIEGCDLQSIPFMLEFLPASSRRCLCRCEHKAVQKHVEPRLREVRQKLAADLERWETEFRNAYNACTVELLFGLACSTVLWRKPSLCLLVFPVIGSAAGLASLAGMLPCGLRRLLAQRRVKCFPHEGIAGIAGKGRIEGS